MIDICNSEIIYINEIFVIIKFKCLLWKHFNSEISCFIARPSILQIGMRVTFILVWF